MPLAVSLPPLCAPEPLNGLIHKRAANVAHNVEAVAPRAGKVTVEAFNQIIGGGGKRAKAVGKLLKGDAGPMGCWTSDANETGCSMRHPTLHLGREPPQKKDSQNGRGNSL